MSTPPNSEYRSQTPGTEDAVGKGVMVSCQHATLLSTIKEEQGLSLRQRMQLHLHLLFCKYCRRFAEQNRKLTALMRLLRSSDQYSADTLPSDGQQAVAPLDEAQKAAIEAALENKIKKK